VQGAAEVGIVVLSDPTFEITGLTDVGLALGIEENVDIVRHERTRKQWLPLVDAFRTLCGVRGTQTKTVFEDVTHVAFVR